MVAPAKKAVARAVPVTPSAVKVSPATASAVVPGPSVVPSAKPVPKKAAARRRVTNVNRLATSRTLQTQLDALVCICGLTIQAHRAYESPTRQSHGLLQTDVANKADTTQNVVSDLENGKKIPADPILGKILTASGFDLSTGTGGEQFLKLLQLIRDQKKTLLKVCDEKPK